MDNPKTNKNRDDNDDYYGNESFAKIFPRFNNISKEFSFAEHAKWEIFRYNGKLLVLMDFAIRTHVISAIILQERVEDNRDLLNDNMNKIMKL